MADDVLQYSWRLLRLQVSCSVFALAGGVVDDQVSGVISPGLMSFSLPVVYDSSNILDAQVAKML